ncbi:MAG: hypothetical protein JWO35_582 [Candidatus Saccharibacteria bacterium]|nr:hypothetical protein [Candidatus Saccharibacteria bacterium]
MSERGKMRVGITPSEMYCLGLSRPITELDIAEAIRPGLTPSTKHNADGTQTVRFEREQFGDNESDRWGDFEVFAQEFAAHIGKFALDLDPRLLGRDETTLFGQRR